MKKFLTIHNSRTIMFSELEKVMAFSHEGYSFEEALQQNVIGKKSYAGSKKTAGYLKSLYEFDLNQPAFMAFQYFWKIADVTDRPLLAFLMATSKDRLLAESITVMKRVPINEKVKIELLERNIDQYHPNAYSVNTRKSMAQNIASTWKQAGFIEGKVKNIRVQPQINYRIACFAFLLAYLAGDRGDFIWNNNVVNALCLNEIKLRELALESAKNDLMQTKRTY